MMMIISALAITTYVPFTAPPVPRPCVARTGLLLAQEESPIEALAASMTQVRPATF